MRPQPCRLGRLPTRLWTAPGPGPRVLALHGFTGGGADFEAFQGALHLVAPDLPGHGGCPVRSAGAADRQRSARALGALADRARCDVLLGYSMGGRLALSLALQRPERWQALVLVGASPGLEDPDARAARALRDEQLARRIEQIGVARFAQEWARQPLIATQSRILPHLHRGMQARRAANRAGGLAASLRGLGTGVMPSLWGRLGELDLPVLLLSGADDPKFGAIARRMRGLLPDATAEVVPGAGHCAHLEAPGATLAAIERLLSRARRS